MVLVFFKNENSTHAYFLVFIALFSLILLNLVTLAVPASAVDLLDSLTGGRQPRDGYSPEATAVEPATPVIPEGLPVGTQELPVGAQELSVGTQELPVGAQELSVGAQELPVGAQELSDEQYVVWLYLNLLERKPDQTGFDLHLGNLKRGTSREYVYLYFTRSDEYKALQAGKTGERPPGQKPPVGRQPKLNFSPREGETWFPPRGGFPDGGDLRQRFLDRMGEQSMIGALIKKMKQVCPHPGDESGFTFDCAVGYYEIEEAMARGGFTFMGTGSLDAFRRERPHMDAGREIGLKRLAKRERGDDDEGYKLPQGPQLTDEEYVRWLYRSLLGRQPDAFGYDLHLRNLKRGTSREYVYRCFLDSDEYRAKHGDGDVEPPQDPPPPPPDQPPAGKGRLLISLHVQGMMDGVEQFLRSAKPTLIKVFNWEDARLVKQVSPTTLTVMRSYVGHQDMSPGNARRYVQSMLPDLKKYAPYVDFLESYNETIAGGRTDEIKAAVRFDCEFADALAETGLPIAPLLLTVPVGNPLDAEIELLLPAARKAVENGGALGYHAYWPANMSTCYLENGWDQYAGRWQQWDRVFVRHGLYPLYILGEVGATGTPGRQANGSVPMLPHDGWRSDKCLGGNWSRHLDQIRRFQDRIRHWNTENFGRCLGATLFTTGPDYTGWQSYQIRKPQMESLVKMHRDGH